MKITPTPVSVDLIDEAAARIARLKRAADLDRLAYVPDFDPDGYCRHCQAPDGGGHCDGCPLAVLAVALLES